MFVCCKDFKHLSKWDDAHCSQDAWSKLICTTCLSTTSENVSSCPYRPKAGAKSLPSNRGERCDNQPYVSPRGLSRCFTQLYTWKVTNTVICKVCRSVIPKSEMCVGCRRFQTLCDDQSTLFTLYLLLLWNVSFIVVVWKGKTHPLLHLRQYIMSVQCVVNVSSLLVCRQWRLTCGGTWLFSFSAVFGWSLGEERGGWSVSFFRHSSSTEETPGQSLTILYCP